MQTDIQIIPAILATTEEEYKEKLERIEGSPELAEGWVQIDLMDNKFVQNKSISAEIIAKYPTSLKREVHLMVEYPENWIDELVKVGVERIIFPVEDAEGVLERIKHIKDHGIKVGLSVNPETPVEKISAFIGTIDVVLLMSVRPGFGGQEFIPDTVEKVKRTVILRSGYKFLVEVDGGVNEEVAKDLAEAGVDSLVIGEHLINGDITENLEKIWESIRA